MVSCLKKDNHSRAVVGVALLLLILTGLQVGKAQPVELLVQPKTGSALETSLQTGAVPKQSGDSLFVGVQSVSALLNSTSRRNKTKGKGESLLAESYRLVVADSSALRRLQSRWQSHSEVQLAHPNYVFEVHSNAPRQIVSEGASILDPQNALADSLDHLDVIRSPEAWSVTAGSSDVRIGVIDTGVYLDHPDLTGQFWVNDAEDINGNGRFDPYPAREGGDLNGEDDDGNGYVDDVIGYDFVDRAAPIDAGEFRERDPDPSADPKQFFSWHGTAVAGVSSASPGTAEAGVAGVAPHTRLVPLRAFGGDGRGRTDDIAAAIMYAADQGVDVLNLSFGRDRAVPLIEKAITYANEQGTVVVASAGNELTDEPHYPSDYPDVLSVVWLGEDGTLPRFNRSQFGIGVDLGAPGSNVYTTNFPAETLREGKKPMREDLYRSPNGSSFSAPQVAGAAALLRSADSSLSPASIRSILTASAVDIEGANWDHETGAGLLDVAQSLMRAYPARTEIDRPGHNQGVRGNVPVPIVGTAVDPAFQHYALYYARGTKNFDTRPDPWQEIVPPQQRQVLRDTLGTWTPSSLAAGEYTLRLVTRLQDGRTVEDRRRVWVDDSPPLIRVHFLGFGRAGGENGVIADIETDDVTRLRLQVSNNGQTETVQSEHRARRHGLSWTDEQGRGGKVKVDLRATNATGLSTTIDTTIRIPRSTENTGLFQRIRTSQPRGRLLPTTVDFDRDGLREIVLNRFVEGGASDTLRSFEWAGTELASADTLAIGPFFPKDVGDTDSDGREELLLQVNFATLLLEQSSADAFPTEVVYADTSRISEAPGDTLDGARLTDLDSDGRGEIVGADQRQWRIIEHKKSGFEEIAELENPTAVGSDSAQGNVFDFPEAEPGDFDGDGRRDLLVGDRDGDLLIYEATGDDQFEVAWTHETDRVNAGTRFASGDVDGNGRTEFVTMTTNPLGTRSGGRKAPPISYYSVWQGTGDNAYERVFRLPIEGPFTPQGSLASADIDGDGRPEVVIAHPPSLLVLDRTPDGTWQVRFEDRPSSVLSRSLLAADVSGTGVPSVYAGTNNGHLVEYRVNSAALAVPPPRWVTAKPGGPATAELKWRAPGADSVVVYGGPREGELNRVRATTDSAATIRGDRPRRFALRAWAKGEPSPLSNGREVRPHSPATVSAIDYPTPQSVRLTFTEALAPNTRHRQFRFGADSTSPRRLVRTGNGRGVVLSFSEEVEDVTGSLTWSGVEDASGLPVGQTSTTVTFPRPERRTLFVEEATILDERRVRLSFNEALDPASAGNVERYDVQPRGQVADIQVDGASTITLRLDGIIIGARGGEASLTVTEMTSATGSRLAEEGRTVRLTKPADDLSNVYVYPNPYRARQHGDQLTIGGLPSRATIRVYTPGGRLVRVLSVENNRNGGHRWDLRNRRGDRVPSGVYLFRVNAPDQSPILEKAAVIR
jgi:subtilisin family serine protease